VPPVPRFQPITRSTVVAWRKAPLGGVFEVDELLGEVVEL